MTDLEELKRLAEAATKGEWRAVYRDAFKDLPEYWELFAVGFDHHEGGATGLVEGDDTGLTEADAAFIAAANPSTILSLIERVERAEDDRAEAIATVNFLQTHLAQEQTASREAEQRGYLRGLEEAAKVADIQQLDLIESASLSARRGDAFGCTESAMMFNRAEEIGEIAQAIRNLKGE